MSPLFYVLFFNRLDAKGDRGVTVKLREEVRKNKKRKRKRKRKKRHSLNQLEKVRNKKR